jgi:FKBP-type peptidyl-prolyl cis-trans isomerase FklB
MRTLISTSLVLLGTMTAAHAQDKPAAAPKLKTTVEKASYAIGVNIGRDLKQNGIEVNSQLLTKGLIDALSDGKLLLTDDEMRMAITTLQKEMTTKREAKRAIDAEKNLAVGKAFLVTNKGQPGVKTLKSGLQYKVIKAGKGTSPKATDQVKTHYEGRLINGKVFDSSYKRGEPATFPVNGVIKGWTEALQLMKPGSQWELYVPAELGYGARGAGANIGPNSTLIFKVELLEVVK